MQFISTGMLQLGITVKDHKTLNNVTVHLYTKTPASFTKARYRVMKVLPKSPRKRQEVVKSLAVNILNAYAPKPQNRGILKEVKSLVISHYEHDSVSVMMPGKADFVTPRMVG